MTDRYTLIESGDSDDAENVASMFGHPALVDYVHPNEQFTIQNIDDTNDEIDISAGKAYIGHSGEFNDGSTLQTSTGDVRKQAMFTVEHPGESNLSLTVNSNTRTTNYVWLDAQVGTGGPIFRVNTSSSAPSEASLLIATIDVEDTNGDNSSEEIYSPSYHNRGPEIVADSISAGTDNTISVDGISLDGELLINGNRPATSVSHTVPTSYFSGPAHGEGSSAFIGATVLPDGRAVFAPFDSSNVGLFDPSNNSYTSGPAHGEGSSAFIGATVLPDGRAVFAPFDSSNVGLFDPSDNTYTSGPAHGEGGDAFQGATVLPDGRAVFAPRDSSNVGLFDPSNNSYTSGPAHGEGSSAFTGATVLPDGRAVFAPRESSNVGLFDPSNNTYTSGPAHGEGASAFQGATVLPDGRAVFSPRESSNVGLFDPSDNTYTSGPAHEEGGDAFQGATVLPDGRAVFAPYDSSNVGLFDPSNNTYTSGPAHGEGASAFQGATVLPDGRAVFAPYNSSNVGITSVIPAFANASSSKR